MRYVNVIYLVLLHVINYHSGITQFYDVNKICEAESGKIATYLHIEQCPSTIEMVKRRSQPRTCYFQGDNPIVYCEDEQKRSLIDSNRYGPTDGDTTTAPIYTPIQYSEVPTATTPKLSTVDVTGPQAGEILSVVTSELNAPAVTRPQAGEILAAVTSKLSAPAVTGPQAGEILPVNTPKLSTSAATGLQASEILQVITPNLGIPITSTTQIGERSRRACKGYESLSKNITYDSIGNEITETRCPWNSNGLVADKSRIGEYPHIAMLGVYNDASRQFNFLCSGTLISERFILTLAACLHPKSFVPNSVRLGDIDYTNPNDNEFVQQINIKQHHMHPNYTFDQLYYDIGLIELDEPVNISLYIKPACIYLQEPVDDIPKSTHIGWMTHEYGINGHLLKTKTNLVSTDKCEKVYGSNNKLPSGLDKSSMGCYTFASEDNICRCLLGDPIQTESSTAHCSYEVFGMTAFGQICDATPVGYIKIYPYIDWIESIVWP